MNAIINGWNNFVEKHPAASKWIREGGLFMIVSNVITVFKYLRQSRTKKEQQKG